MGRGRQEEKKDEKKEEEKKEEETNAGAIHLNATPITEEILDVFDGLI